MKILARKVMEMAVVMTASLLGSQAVFAQTIVSSQTSTSSSSSTVVTSTSTPVAPLSPTVQAFRQEQLALSSEMKALSAQGTTAKQMIAWQQQNAARFAAQQQRAQLLGAASASQPSPLCTTVFVPEGASQELSDYLVTQTDLYNRLAQMHNQLLQTGASMAGNTQSLSPGMSEVAIFQQQNAAELQTYAKQFQVVAAQLSNRSVPALPPAIIPSDASSQLQAYIKLRDQIMREQMQIWTQYANSTPDARFAAMQLWTKQNAARLTQLQQLAQSLSQPPN